MKTFFKLTGSYPDLKVRRLAQVGRLWLVQVINDQPPYWFIQLRSFDRQKDLDLVPEMTILPHDNCTFRFTDLAKAKIKFSVLANHPKLVEEEKKRQKLASERREAIKKRFGLQ